MFPQIPEKHTEQMSAILSTLWVHKSNAICQSLAGWQQQYETAGKLCDAEQDCSYSSLFIVHHVSNERIVFIDHV